MSFSIALIRVKFSKFFFFDFLDLNIFLTILLAFLLLKPSTTLLLSALNTFEANIPDDPIVFNIKVNNIAILQIKRQ